MSKCDCYDPSFGGLCNGTKEIESCYCEDNECKCDFYPTVRAKAKAGLNTKEPIDAVTFIKWKSLMCDVIDNECKDCLISKEINKSGTDEFCEDWIINNPEKAVELVAAWYSEYNKPITWYEWLHYVQNYYGGLSCQKFTDWLNAPIPEDAKKKYNIPNKV